MNEYWLIRTSSLESDDFRQIKLLGRKSGLPHQKLHWIFVNNKAIIQADFSQSDIAWLQSQPFARRLGRYLNGFAEQKVYDSAKANHWGKNGINYYHESMGYISRTDLEIDIDLDRIASKNRSIKVYHNPYNSNALAICKTIVQKAKAKGFYVVWTENNDTIHLTAKNWDDYASKVVADATEAQSVESDEFLVGNEISIHNDESEGFNDTNLPNRIKQLAQDCSNSFTNTISYEDGWWKKDAWYKAGLGNLSKIYFTLYENIADFEKYAKDIWDKFRTKAVIGEWSTQSVMDTVSGTDEDDWKDKLLARQKILDELGLVHFIFCYRDTGVDNNNRGFGLWKYTIDEPHDIWNYI